MNDNLTGFISNCGPWQDPLRKKIWSHGKFSISVTKVWDELFFMVDWPDGSEQGFATFEEALDALSSEVLVNITNG